MNRRKNNRNAIILVAVVVSLILYFSGVFSGLYANKILEERTSEKLESIKQETEKDLDSIKNDTQSQISHLEEYISFLESNINSMQLEQSFLSTLNKSEMCDFSDITFDHLLEQMNLYWSRLPFRIEQYETEHELSEDYLMLKKQYNQLSIRTWIFSKHMYETCGTDYIHGLYFYSRDCEDCIDQGQELDRLKDALDQNMILFTIDADSDEAIIEFIKTYYGIDEVPAVLINENVYQGRVFSYDELLGDIQ